MTEAPISINREASYLATTICALVDGHVRENVMAALTCATGRALAAIGIPAQAMDECLELYVKQVREHHAKYLEDVRRAQH